MRADQLLVTQGHAPTRSAAVRLIDQGAVRWLGPRGWAVPRKAGEDLPDGCQIEVTDDAELRYVSRGGLKLEAALDRCGLSVAGLRCLDAGQSTGGFTDVLLHCGAASVVGIDVGHGQLHPRLSADERVQAYEGINARDVGGSVFAQNHAERSFALVCGDLSFISLTLVLPTLVKYLAPAGHLLMLVKPQFELQPQHIGRGGIVKDERCFAMVEARIRAACAAEQLAVRDYFQCAVSVGGHGSARGGAPKRTQKNTPDNAHDNTQASRHHASTGNTEFFVWAQPAAPNAPASSASP
jgi:23S rRNA (cytidine1920-2'-O)/16S rRNA (cytidine1409-2'-O)-methyltransferase